MISISISEKQINSVHNNDIIYFLVFDKTGIYLKNLLLLTHHRVVVTSNISMYWLFLSKYYPTLLSPLPLSLLFSLSPLLVSVASISTFPFHLRVCVNSAHMSVYVCGWANLYLSISITENRSFSHSQFHFSNYFTLIIMSQVLRPLFLTINSL